MSATGRVVADDAVDADDADADDANTAAVDSAAPAGDTADLVGGLDAAADAAAFE